MIRNKQSLALVLVGAVALVGSAGCETPAARKARLEKEEKANRRLDEIQSQLMSMNEQLVDLKTKQQEAPPVKEVIPVDRVPSGGKVLDDWATSYPQSPVEQRSGRSRGGSVNAKNVIRVGVPVQAVQQALANAGFSPGKVDGKVGERTVAAIRAFQRSQGLKVDGVVGGQTWAKLKMFISSPK